MNLVIVLATAADAALVQSLSAAAYVPAYQAVIGAVPKPATEDYADRIAQRHVWLAYDDVRGGPLGVLVLDPAPESMLVYSVAVDPRHQGKGYATALLMHAEVVARARGYQAISLFTNKRMARNVALYERIGYVGVGERPHPSRKGETLLDMAKHLS